MEPSPSTRSDIESMCATLRHRGPDDEDGTVRAVFNGEIYGFRRLREHLWNLGHRFEPATDGEVIVHLPAAVRPLPATALN